MCMSRDENTKALPFAVNGESRERVNKEHRFLFGLMVCTYKFKGGGSGLG